MSTTLPLGPPRLRLREVSPAEVVIVADGRCPECAGGWMRWLLHDHANDCGLRDELDATLAADHDALRGGGSDLLLRPLRPAERLLAGALGVPAAALPEDVEVTVRRLTPGVLRVWTVGSFDLDVLATADELVAA